MSCLQVLTLVLSFGCGCFLAEICPPNWHRFGESCYFITDTMNWYQANRTCAEFRAKLAIPNSQSEQDYLLELFREVDNDLTSTNSFWIACNDIEEEGKWQPCSLNNETNAYENWKPGEPNGANGADCGVVHAGLNGKWDDIHCTRRIFNATCELSVCSRLTPQCLLHHAMEELLGKSAMHHGKASQSHPGCHSFLIDNCCYQ